MATAMAASAAVSAVAVAEEEVDSAAAAARVTWCACAACRSAPLRHGCQMAIARILDQILCVWPFGLLDYGSAMLRCKIFLQGKEGIKFCSAA